MKKILIISLAVISISIIVNSQTKFDLCKKWYFKGYIYAGLPFPPEMNEKNDYINFKQDGSFSCLDEGIFEEGTWNLEPNNNISGNNRVFII